LTGPRIRRFPPRWTVEELDACFVVRDAGGQKLGYFYYEEEPGRRSAAKLLTRFAADWGQRREVAGVAAGRLSLRLPIRRINMPHVQTRIRKPRRTTRSEHNVRTYAQTILVQ
jgi:hypothetical protein